ncbi:MAG: hypothetical protein JNM68_10255, partial [Dinghuibacter sp.]|nr:hypothetical protein [Dinghuibacter sp.]
IVFTLYKLIQVSDTGEYEFTFMASRTKVLLLLTAIATVSLLLGMVTTWLILRNSKNATRWLWVLICCFPALFVGALCLHFVFMLNAWV